MLSANQHESFDTWGEINSNFDLMNCDGIPNILQNSILLEYFKTKWKFKESDIVTTPVWEELFHCESSSHKVDDLLVAMNKKYPDGEMGHYSSFLRDPFERLGRLNISFDRIDDIIASGEHYTNRLYYLEKLYGQEFIERLEENNNKIGFLLVELTNLDTEPITNIDFHFLLTELKHINDQDPKSKEVLRKKDNLNPSESIIMLLSIYEKDNKGYPHEYRSSKLETTKISYDSKYGRNEELINKPLKDLALKSPIPFGWEGQ